MGLTPDPTQTPVKEWDFCIKKEPAFLQVLVELMTRFELVTSSLPITIYTHTEAKSVPIEVLQRS